MNTHESDNDKSTITEHNGMKIGDLITTAYSGYFELTEIHPSKRRSSDSILFVFEKRYTTNGGHYSSKIPQSCDSEFCSPAEKIIQNRIRNHYRIIDSLSRIISTL